MEIRKDLELVEVEYENNGKKAVMTFLDRERREVRIVNFNCQSYKDGKYVDDPDKVEKVEEWCHEYFNCEFDDLKGAVGCRKDIYVYDSFNSVFECDIVEKFTGDMEGQIYQTSIKEITLDDYAIRIRYEIEGKTYESKMSFGMYMKQTKEWFVDPNKKAKQMERFKDKFGVPIEEAESLIGHELMVEVKAAFGETLYGDIKKFPQKKRAPACWNCPVQMKAMPCCRPCCGNTPKAKLPASR